MAIYSYQAINEQGTNVTGTVEADSVEMAENALLAKGSLPEKITATSGGQAGAAPRSHPGLLTRFLPGRL